MKRMTCVCAVAVVVMATVVGAQEPAAASPPVRQPPAREVAKEQVPLKIQLVLSRYHGEKKLSSAPYVLWVTANDSLRSTNLRVGVDAPVPAGSGQFQYRNIGTSIDCTVVSAVDGKFKITLTVADTSVYSADRDNPGSIPSGGAPPPAIRSFTSLFSLLLRDGQTAQYTSATDQVSGEVLKIDATLNVLK